MTEIKKIRKAVQSFTDHSAEVRSPGKYGIFVDGEMVGTIEGDNGSGRAFSKTYWNIRRESDGKRIGLDFSTLAAAKVKAAEYVEAGRLS